MNETLTVRPPEMETFQILKEVMNMAVGRAAGEMENLFHFSMELTVPEAHDLARAPELGELEAALHPSSGMCIIEQEFFGPISGNFFLTAELKSLSQLFSVFDRPELTPLNTDNNNPLAQYAALEIGSILTGSCIGALVELANSVVSFGMPSFRMCEKAGDCVGMAGEEDSRIALYSALHVNQFPVVLRLILLLPPESADHITSVVADYA